MKRSVAENITLASSAVRVNTDVHPTPDPVWNSQNPEALYDNEIYHGIYTCLSCSHWDGMQCCAEHGTCNYTP